MITYWIKKQIQKRLTETNKTRTVLFRDYWHIQTISILLHQEQLESILPFLSELRKDGKNIHLFILDLRKEPILSSSIENVNKAVIITAKQLRLFKMLPDKATENLFLQDTNSFVICDLTIKECLPFLYLVSASKARLKMGFLKKELNPYDFMIESEEIQTSGDLAKNLLFYLRTIDIENNNL